MPLNYNLSKCAEPEGASEKFLESRPYFAFVLMMIGIPTVTEKNVEKVLKRYQEATAVMEHWMTIDGKACRWSNDGVRAMIGFSTNASTYSDAKWRAVLQRMAHGQGGAACHANGDLLILNER